MKKKKKKATHLKLWTIGVLAIVLLAAPSTWAMITYEGGGEYDITTDLNDNVEIKDGTTVNLRATVNGYLQAHPGSVLNIYSGSVFYYVVVSSGQPADPQVTVYGTDFAVDGTPTTASEFIPAFSTGSVLTGIYGNGQAILPTAFKKGLWFVSNNIPIYLKEPASQEPEVTIDIKPGSDENVINLGSRGVVPVAVITADGFEASNIDPDTVEFAGASPVHTAVCDVDEDGDMDMLFHFRTQELDLDENSTEATLTGVLKSAVTKSSALTTSGNSIEGTDKVKVKSSKKK